MERRTRNIIIAVLILAVIIIAVIIWWFLNRNKEEVVLPPNQNTNQGLIIPADVPISNQNQLLNPDEQNMYAEIKSVAMVFAERFGSYSNETNFRNLEDAEPLMTLKMKNWAQNFRIENESEEQLSDYYGVSTNSLNANITAFDEQLLRADVVVQTQRNEWRYVKTNPRTYYQSISLKMVKNDDGWKIDEADWLE